MFLKSKIKTNYNTQSKQIIYSVLDAKTSN